MKTLWLSSPRATFVVDIDDDEMLIKVPPIAWKWKHKFLDDLIKYFHIDKIKEIR